MKIDRQIMNTIKQITRNKSFQLNNHIHSLMVFNPEGMFLGEFEFGEEGYRQHHFQKEDFELIRKQVIGKNKIGFLKIERLNTWMYFSPVQIDRTVECYISCFCERVEDKMFMQMLSLLSELISTKFRTYRSVASDFLDSIYQRQLCHHFSEGYMTVDRDGYIRYLNPAGSNILGLDAELITGTKLDEHADFSINILDSLERKESLNDEEIFVKTAKASHHLVKTVIPLISEYDEPLGILVIFKEMTSMRKMVNDIVGSNANFQFDHILHRSEKMKRLILLAKRAAHNDSNILIEGESGTGKELLVQAIHNHSSRRNGPFVAIDCSSIPRELIESELFGYVEGSFTGARKGGRMGKFELANGGTVFLDEIGEMPLEMQARLLRVIQNRKVIRVGGNEEIPIDIRIIAATNRDLEVEVSNNNFRLDLFYRLNVIHLSVPPLRERIGDIPLLVQAFAKKAARRERKEVPNITSEAMEVLESYNWPGNVRELENAIERAVVLTNGEIGKDILPERVFRSSNSLSSQSSINNEYESSPINPNSLKSVEHQAIIEAIRESNGNITRAAKKLGISRTTLYSRLKKANYDLQPDARFVKEDHQVRS
ncbi:sigma-54 interaction domain-containing protein [Bacillus sp. 1P02SD]|uniref:sigma-54 interaction domain-containing protein n=1 Tax=Bacillus sp. 1P02SD TaxID=3132264 RepID=UPI0039A16236